MPIETTRPAAVALERRKGDRRGMDALRAEALQTLITRVEDKNFGGLRNRVQWSQKITPQRLVLLAVALLAGGLAAYLAMQHDQPAVAEAPVVEVKAVTVQVLVAKQAIGAGQRLSPTAVEWQDWPETAIRPDYLTIAATPSAATDVAGSMARSEIFAGEPILQQKLAPAGHGFLSAILTSGMRGVSVTVAAASASGGFVVPNDHVDVVLTRASDTGGQESQTILRNARVLGINDRLSASAPPAASSEPVDPSTQAFANEAIATLELDPTQAELIINASMTGRLSLMLRASTDTPAAATTPTPRGDDGATNAAIRLTSPFWKK